MSSKKRSPKKAAKRAPKSAPAKAAAGAAAPAPRVTRITTIVKEHGQAILARWRKGEAVPALAKELDVWPRQLYQILAAAAGVPTFRALLNLDKREGRERTPRPLVAKRATTPARHASRRTKRSRS